MMRSLCPAHQEAGALSCCAFPSRGRLGYACAVRRAHRDGGRGLAYALLLALAGCAAEGAAAGEAEPPELADEGPVPPAPERVEHVSADGIEARLLSDGSVRLEGIDRFGQTLSVTYADASYFRNAVPVLARSLTPAQADALRAFAEQLPGGGAP